MANRPVFQSLNYYPYCRKVDVEFEWFSGFSTAQKQRSIESLHTNYKKRYTDSNTLEISSKSKTELGIKLSAFNLKLPTDQGEIPVECLYQAGKVFTSGGPYTDLLSKTPKEAKKDERLKTSGKITHFELFGEKYPNVPITFFYNWLYMNALYRNEELSKELLEYDSFTDIVFNPNKSLNCQAQAAAIYVGLCKAGEIEYAMKSKENFMKIVYNKKYVE